MSTIKKGDKVVVISGDQKGTEGEVKQVFPALSKVVVEGINVRKRHVKGRNGTESKIVEVTLPISRSKVSILQSKKSGNK